MIANLITTETTEIISPNKYYKLCINKIGKIIIFHVYDINNLPPLISETIIIPFPVKDAVGVATGNDGSVGTCLIDKNKFSVLTKEGLIHSWCGILVTVLEENL